MNKLIILIFLFAFFVMGSDTLTAVDSSYVIFPENEKKFSFLFDVGTDFWTPTHDDIKNIEPIIKNYLKKKAPKIFKKIASYKRQYVGVILGKHQILFVNFFCDDDQEYRIREVVVDDGGDCYLKLKINMKKKTCFDLYINGEA